MAPSAPPPYDPTSESPFRKGRWSAFVKARFALHVLRLREFLTPVVVVLPSAAMNGSMLCLTAAGWVFAAGILESFAEQVTLTAIADTALMERARTNNLGGASFIPAGTTGEDGNFSRNRILLKFDVAAALPAGALIQSASVYFRVVRAPVPENSANSNFAGHRIFKPWGEGVKGFVDPQVPMQSTLAASPGEATWNQRFHGDAGSAWTPPGGDFTDDDFAELESFEFFVLAGGDRDYTANLTATGLQDLRDWLAAPGENHGWVLRSESENIGYTARQFASRESTVATNRPQLTIVYSMPEPDPPTITSITRDGTSVVVTFSGQANVLYHPQHRREIQSGTWNPLPLVGPLTVDGMVSFTNDVGSDPERYFRVIVP